MLTLNMDARQAITLVMDSLASAGLQVLQSFDLRMARATQIYCCCPYHGTEDCDCQMLVLLVYGHDENPTTLIAHGHDGRTFLSLVDNPQQRSEAGALELIRQALLAK